MFLLDCVMLTADMIERVSSQDPLGLVVHWPSGTAIVGVSLDEDAALLVRVSGFGNVVHGAINDFTENCRRAESDALNVRRSPPVGAVNFAAIELLERSVNTSFGGLAGLSAHVVKSYRNHVYHEGFYGRKY
jgi:hypothetical protein